MIDISVIIVNYNTCHITCECLNSIFSNTRDVTFEVIVVDNNSQRDDSRQVLRRYPNIKYIQSDINLGFGKANNLGYKFACGRYILLLNSDTYLLNNAFKLFVDSFDQLSDDVACVGCQLLSSDGEKNNSYGEFPSLSSTIRATASIYLRLIGLRLRKKQIIEANEQSPFYVPYVMGADLCIRRAAIESCGLFDPDFFMYYEETEMQHRYMKAGYKAMIVPGPRIVHLECVSTQGSSKKKYTYSNRKMFLQGQFLYFRKVYSYPLYLIYRFVYFFNLPIYFRPYYSWIEKIKLMGRLMSSTRLSK